MGNDVCCVHVSGYCDGEREGIVVPKSIGEGHSRAQGTEGSAGWRLEMGVAYGKGGAEKVLLVREFLWGGIQGEFYLTFTPISICLAAKQIG